MADWTNPTITSQYDVFVNEAKARDVDSATMFLTAPTNQPTGSVQMVRIAPSSYQMQEWSGSTWTPKTLAVVGGGTGGSDAASARTALGIGTMGVQNSNTVAISGGTITGLTSLGLNCSIVFGANVTYDVGALNFQVNRGYFGNALVIPVGVDKFATS